MIISSSDEVSLDHSHIAGRNTNGTTSVENSLVSYPTRFITYDPAIVLLGIYLREMKTYVHSKSHTEIFTAALFVNSQTLKTIKILFKR